MTDNDLYGSLEERLSDEARRMLDDSPCPPMPALQAKLLLHRRRRAVTTTACATAAVVVALVAINLKRTPQGDGVPGLAGAGDSKPFAVETPEVPLSRDSNAALLEDAGVETPLAVAIAILIPPEAEGLEPEFVRGWYVPERVEVLRAADLSPAERSAVSRLLGLDPEISDDETI